MPANKPSELKEVAKLFAKLGVIAFGGPSAHIAMMQDEVVNKRKWMNEQHFLDTISATNMIPGPNSTEMAIHIGYHKAGWKGLLVAGLCFILPAVCITGVFAWFYKTYGTLPQVQPFVYGIKPAIIAIILAAIYPLAKKALKSLELIIIGFAVLVLCLLGYNEILVMFGAGFCALTIFYFQSKAKNGVVKNTLPFAFISATNANLFFVFLKIGAILFGSGYVLFAFLDNELVSKDILSRQQLIDAIAVGQFTPGPVFSSVTFIGYQINGIGGAIVSTIGVFLPSFVFVALLNPFIPRMRKSKTFSAFLDAVNVASLAIIVTVCYTMARQTITDWKTISIALISLIILTRFRINSALIVLGSSIFGYVLLML
jgi:chromate transporter